MAVGNAWRVFIDGHDISHYVNALEFKAVVGSATRIEVTLIAKVMIDPDGTITLGKAGVGENVLRAMRLPDE